MPLDGTPVIDPSALINLSKLAPLNSFISGNITRDGIPVVASAYDELIDSKIVESKAAAIYDESALDPYEVANAISVKGDAYGPNIAPDPEFNEIWSTSGTCESTGEGYIRMYSPDGDYAGGCTLYINHGIEADKVYIMNFYTDDLSSTQRFKFYYGSWKLAYFDIRPGYVDFQFNNGVASVIFKASPYVDPVYISIQFTFSDAISPPSFPPPPPIDLNITRYEIREYY